VATEAPPRTHGQPAGRLASDAPPSGLARAYAATSEPAESAATSPARGNPVTRATHVENAQTGSERRGHDYSGRRSYRREPSVPIGWPTNSFPASLGPRNHLGATKVHSRSDPPTRQVYGRKARVSPFICDIYSPDGADVYFFAHAISGMRFSKAAGYLFGRTETGGVVQVHTKDPQFAPSADFSRASATTAFYRRVLCDRTESIGPVPPTCRHTLPDRGNGLGP